MTKSLKVSPFDLTRIYIRNGGRFPLKRIVEIISGEEQVPGGHGTRRDAVWGPLFSRVDDDEDLGLMRIDALARCVAKIKGSRSLFIPAPVHVSAENCGLLFASVNDATEGDSTNAHPSIRDRGSIRYSHGMSRKYADFAGAADPPRGEAVVQLLFESKNEAIEIKDYAAIMESYTWSEVTIESRCIVIDRLRDRVDAARLQLAQFEVERATASSWQKTAIDRIAPLLDELASDTQAVIDHLDRPGGLRKFREHRELLAANAHEVAELAAWTDRAMAGRPVAAALRPPRCRATAAPNGPKRGPPPIRDRAVQPTARGLPRRRSAAWRMVYWRRIARPRRSPTRRGASSNTSRSSPEIIVEPPPRSCCHRSGVCGPIP